MKKQEEIAVHVPGGVNHGEMIRMPGRGEAVGGGAAGDLYIKLHVKPDTRFGREGHNLTTTLTIKLSEALLGDMMRINTLDGEEMLSIPAGTLHGDTLRLRAKGVPHGRGNRGDLLVRIAIEIPKKLSKEQKRLIEELKREGL